MRTIEWTETVVIMEEAEEAEEEEEEEEAKEVEVRSETEAMMKEKMTTKEG